MRKFKSIYLLIFILFSYEYINAQFTNVMIDNSTGPEEPSVSINPLDTKNIIAGSNADNYYYSTDGGATWITNILNSSFL